MNWFKHGKYIISILLVSLVMLSGCVSQEAHLRYSPDEELPVPTATSVITPKPEASPYYPEMEPANGEPVPTDSLGIGIIDPDEHYFKFYVSFSNIRIYEENGCNYLDGICLNGYENDLTGRCRVMFFDGAGQKCGEGNLHTSDSISDLNLLRGENRVFSEISSETDISSCAFEIETVSAFYPFK